MFAKSKGGIVSETKNTYIVENAALKIELDKSTKHWDQNWDEVTK